MKIIISALALLLPAISFAELKRPGTFVPSLCSVSERSERARPDIVAVKSVCQGIIVGFTGQVIQLQINDGEVRNYSVLFERHLPGGMGTHSVNFKGNRLMAMGEEGSAETITGSTSTTSGITVTHGISLRTSGNLTFRGAMEMVFTTQ